MSPKQNLISDLTFVTGCKHYLTTYVAPLVEAAAAAAAPPLEVPLSTLILSSWIRQQL